MRGTGKLWMKPRKSDSKQVGDTVIGEGGKGPKWSNIRKVRKILKVVEKKTWQGTRPEKEGRL